MPVHKAKLQKYASGCTVYQSGLTCSQTGRLIVVDISKQSPLLHAGRQEAAEVAPCAEVVPEGFDLH